MGNMGIQEEIISGFVQFAVLVLSIVGAAGLCAVVWSFFKDAKYDD